MSMISSWLAMACIIATVQSLPVIPESDADSSPSNLAQSETSDAKGLTAWQKDTAVKSLDDDTIEKLLETPSTTHIQNDDDDVRKDNDEKISPADHIKDHILAALTVPDMPPHPFVTLKEQVSEQDETKPEDKDTADASSDVQAAAKNAAEASLALSDKVQDKVQDDVNVTAQKKTSDAPVEAVPDPKALEDKQAQNAVRQAEEEAERQSQQKQKAAKEEADRQSQQKQKAAKEEADRQSQQKQKAAKEEADRQSQQKQKAAKEEADRQSQQKQKAAQAMAALHASVAAKIKASTDLKVQHSAQATKQPADVNVSIAREGIDAPLPTEHTSSPAEQATNTSSASAFDLPGMFQSNARNKVLATLWAKMESVEEMRNGFRDSVALARQAVKAAAEESPEKAVQLAESFEEILSSANNAAATSHPILLEKMRNTTKKMHQTITQKLNTEHQLLASMPPAARMAKK